MRRVGVAASSQISANAGAAIADRGGNAVDAAIASAMVSLCTEPGLVAPGAGGFITVWPAGGAPVVIDAYAEMPGRGLPRSRFGRAGIAVDMDYGGGMHTIVGYGSVATPGAVAGCGLAAERFGALPWSALLEPAIRWAEDGFPLPAAAHEYFAYSAKPVFGWHPDSRRAVHHPDGRRIATGETVWIPELAGTLRTLAAEGPDAFYTGSIGHAIADDVQANGGLLTRQDLAEYRAVEREPICFDIDGWEVACNPAPAVGGAAVAAILLLLDARRFSAWDRSGVRRMMEVQRAVLDYRKEHLEASPDGDAAVLRLLEAARLGDHRALLGSPSTIHCSAVDSDGTGCAITMSAGYGSGVMVPGTGLWLNNSLGEVELHPEGFHALEPGTRLISNMAPTLARRGDGSMLAIGSPGADRITTALAQVLVNFLHLGMALSEAVEHPRLHVEVLGDRHRVAHEPGLPVPIVEEMESRPFPDRSMFFGGVQASLWSPGAGLFTAADPRRAGGSARGGG